MTATGFILRPPAPHVCKPPTVHGGCCDGDGTTTVRRPDTDIGLPVGTVLLCISGYPVGDVAGPPEGRPAGPAAGLLVRFWLYAFTQEQATTAAFAAKHSSTGREWHRQTRRMLRWSRASRVLLRLRIASLRP